MPYQRSLSAFWLPEWDALPPDTWESRLRDISPKDSGLSWLRFRYRAPQADWNFSERGVWELYACTPRRHIKKDRAQQFELHWSELPTGEQAGRRVEVSSYQHYLWHTEGVEAKRFWVLQGEWGGTPAFYTRREERYLDAAGAISEPYPLGFFPASPFTERSVNLILERDRLVKAGKNLDELEKAGRVGALAAEDVAAEYEFRKKFLDVTWERLVPQMEFMQSQKAKSEMAGMDLPSAPDSVGSTSWKDHFLEYGTMPSITQTTNRALQVAVQ